MKKINFVIISQINQRKIIDNLTQLKTIKFKHLIKQ